MDMNRFNTTAMITPGVPTRVLVMHLCMLSIDDMCLVEGVVPPWWLVLLVVVSESVGGLLSSKC